MYIRRLAEQHLQRLSDGFPVVLVTGARQVGKTTLLQHAATGTDRRYASLDEFGPRPSKTRSSFSSVTRHP